MRTSILKRWLGACALGVIAAHGFAQTYPTKPINIIVPTPPAGPLDWMARTFGAKLQERWGQPAVVENKPGAGGWLAVQVVQKAAPDGHMLFAYSQTAYSMGMFVKGADFDPGVNIQP